VDIIVPPLSEANHIKQCKNGNGESAEIAFSENLDFERGEMK
jgi:hypothetical protein